MEAEGEFGNIPSIKPSVTVDLRSVDNISGRNRSQFDFEYDCVITVSKTFHHCLESIGKASKNFIRDTEGMISLDYILVCEWSIEDEDVFELGYEFYTYHNIDNHALVITTLSLNFYQDRKVNKNLIKLKDKTLYDCLHDSMEMRNLFKQYLKDVGCKMI